MTGVMGLKTVELLGRLNEVLQNYEETKFKKFLKTQNESQTETK